MKPFAQSHYGVGSSPAAKTGNGPSAGGPPPSGEMALLGAEPSAPSAAGLTPPAPPPPWEGRAIATHKLRLVEFSAFLEQQRDPDTVTIKHPST